MRFSSRSLGLWGEKKGSKSKTDVTVSGAKNGEQTLGNGWMMMTLSVCFLIVDSRAETNP